MTGLGYVVAEISPAHLRWFRLTYERLDGRVLVMVAAPGQPDREFGLWMSVADVAQVVFAEWRAPVVFAEWRAPAPAARQAA